MRQLTILAVVAHPADSFNMIGGTLADRQRRRPVSSEEISHIQNAHVENVAEARRLPGLVAPAAEPKEGNA